MTEQILITAYLCITCLFLGRIWERHDYCSGIGKAARAVLDRPDYVEAEVRPQIHPVQDVTGDLPPLPVEIRFGPPEPRWWMRRITNTRTA